MNLALIAGMLLACSAMLSLCLGLERYYKQLRQLTPAPVVLRTLRGTGWIALLASLACCIQAWGGPMGAVCGYQSGLRKRAAFFAWQSHFCGRCTF